MTETVRAIKEMQEESKRSISVRVAKFYSASMYGGLSISTDGCSRWRLCCKRMAFFKPQERISRVWNDGQPTRWPFV